LLVNCKIVEVFTRFKLISLNSSRFKPFKIFNSTLGVADEASEEIYSLTVAINISNKFFVAEDLLQLPGVGAAYLSFHERPMKGLGEMMLQILHGSVMSFTLLLIMEEHRNNIEPHVEKQK
jgi:hypothetical protein